MQFTPVSLAEAQIIEPSVKLTHSGNLTFTVSAQTGVAPWTWLDHPSGTVGYFADLTTGSPLNGFYLIPGIERTG